MASNKNAGTWADLQESLTRVRQQYGLLPRAGWDDLIAMASYEKAVSEKHRNRKPPRPFLPSITDEYSRTVLDHRNGNKRYSDPGLYKSPVRNRRNYSNSLTSKNMSLKNMEWGRAKTNTEHRINPLFIEKQHFGWDFVESLVFEMLLDEIPDVVIEVLTDIPSAGMQMQANTYSNEMKAMQRSEVLHTSLPQFFLDELLNELLREVSVSVLKMTVKHFVNDYLVKTTLHDLLDEMINSIMQSEMPYLVIQLNKELEEERWIEHFIQNVTDKEVKDIVITVISEYDYELYKQQKNQILMTANKHIVDMFLLEHLLGMVGKHGPMITVKDSSTFLLDSMMLDVLLNQYLIMQQMHQMTTENFPVRNFHQNTFQEVALEVILTELNMMLFEDMEDIYEYEKDIELG